MRRRQQERVPPHNLEAEEALLGAMLLQPDDIAKVLHIVVGPDFYQPGNQLVFEAIAELHVNNQPVDVLTVCDVLDRSGKLDEIGGKARVMHVHGACPASWHMNKYALTVAECGALRRALGYASELTEAAYGYEIEQVDHLLGRAHEHVLAHLATELETKPPVEFLDFSAEAEPVQFIQSGTLIRGDRLLVTGGEGGGKTTFLRQSAVQLACGIKMFTLEDTVRRRVLFFDLQERTVQAKREFVKLRDIARNVGREAERGALQIVFRRSGFNIRNRGDRRWFERHVVNARPDVVIIGPLYKCFSGDKTDETIADEVSIIFDDFVERYDFSILFEAHSPHGVSNDRAGWRPYGASLWMRWPDMGVALAPRVRPKPTKEQPDAPAWWKPGVDIKRFREDRDFGLRVWPDSLLYGDGRPSSWPWEAPLEQVL